MTRMPDAVEIEVVAGSGLEGARRATGGPDPATTLPARAPDPEVPATVQRRRFSALLHERPSADGAVWPALLVSAGATLQG